MPGITEGKVLRRKSRWGHDRGRGMLDNSGCHPSAKDLFLGVEDVMAGRDPSVSQDDNGIQVLRQVFIM